MLNVYDNSFIGLQTLTVIGVHCILTHTYVCFRRAVPPSWHVEPVDTAVIRLSSVAIDCRATGIPEPVVTWSQKTGRWCHTSLLC